MSAVFIIYWHIVQRNLKLQNVFLLLVSYLFYGLWDWRFLILLLAISIVNYLIGIRIDINDSKKIRKTWLILALVLNLGTLGFFKYFNFFTESFADMVSLIGYHVSLSTLKIVMPVGISFYIFLSISYILDIYKKTLVAERDIVNVLLSFGFFPIILSGPINRPSGLLPQIKSVRRFDLSMVTDGLRQILWGLFVKTVIADNISLYADDIFFRYSANTGSTLLLGAVFYTIQIYADFSGYSNISIGVGKLLGFNIVQNFAYPYFARDITEFWKRWHMSLTTWFRDYLFLPVSFSVSWRIKGVKVLYIKTDLFIYIVASLITWFLTGLWHGANYTYIVWGLINGFFLIVYQCQRNPRKKILKKYGLNNNNKLIVFSETILTMIIVIIAWIFFRSQSVKDAINYLGIIFSSSVFTLPTITSSRLICLTISALTILFFIAEWIGKNESYAFAWFCRKKPAFIRWGLYYLLVMLIFFFAGTGQKFIYFQF